jgi:hypothetical protein
MGLGWPLHEQIQVAYESIRQGLLESSSLDETKEELVVMVVSQDGEQIIVQSSEAGTDTDILVLQGQTIDGHYRALLTAPHLIQLTFRKQPRKAKPLGFGRGHEKAAD